MIVFEISEESKITGVVKIYFSKAFLWSSRSGLWGVRKRQQESLCFILLLLPSRTKRIKNKGVSNMLNIFFRY